jgi:hypothetical protein
MSNAETLQKRLNQWEEGKLYLIIAEFKDIHTIPKTSWKKISKSRDKDEILKAVEAVGEGNFKRASELLNPNSCVLMPWSDQTVQKLKDKFIEDEDKPTFSKDSLKGIPSQNLIRITEEDVVKAICSGKSKSGGLNNIGYPTLKQLLKKSELGDALSSAISDLANALSSKNVPNLVHWIASRTIPIKKKMVTQDRYK